jgi:uncharacterized repeat protein (TIGR01451 family)
MPNRANLLLLVAFWSLSWVMSAQNDKQVLGDAVFTPSEIEQGVSVTFLIRFQNLGLDTAANIVIRDTLDPRFDANTVQMIDASHDYEYLRDQGFVRWYFNDIDLPGIRQPLMDFSSSSGYILFKVEPLRFLEGGQAILNSACILFEDQAPLCTNAAAIWIDEEAGSIYPEPSGGQLQIVPNPNYGQFEVRSQQPNAIPQSDELEWWITDMSGKTICDGTSQQMELEIMLERPSPGLYMLWVKEKGALKVEQFAVLR